MASRAIPFLLIGTIGLWSAVGVVALAEEGNPAALAAAMKNATATLQGGLRASEAQGTPIWPSLRSRTENCNCRSIR